MLELKKYFEAPNAIYSRDRGNWLVLLTVHRDSDIPAWANWKAAIQALKGVEGWDVERATHWKVGWIDFLIVRPGSPAHKVAQMFKPPQEYPIFDKSLLSPRSER